MNKAKFIVTIEGDAKIPKEMLQPLADEIKTALENQANHFGLVHLAAEATYCPNSDDFIPDGVATWSKRITVRVEP